MRLRDIGQRTFKAEVELGFSKSESKKESSRCYLCHYQFEINNDLCVLCDECLLVKPVDGCIKEVSSKSVKKVVKLNLQLLNLVSRMESIMDCYISIQKMCSVW